LYLLESSLYLLRGLTGYLKVHHIAGFGLRVLQGWSGRVDLNILDVLGGLGSKELEFKDLEIEVEVV